jgi:hypothetical protein
MPMIDLSDTELTAVANLVRRTVHDDRFPFSPRLAPLKSALAKLDPQPMKPRRTPAVDDWPDCRKPQETEALTSNLRRRASVEFHT